MVLFHILTQFNVPIGKVNEMLPTVVPVQAEVDLHKRTPFRALGLADEVHAGFLRLAVGFLRIAFDAGTNNVFPCRRPAAVARNDVVQVQILPVKHAPAILAGVLVPLKNVVARELYFLLWQPVVNKQQNDSRHADAEGNGADGFLLRRVFGNVAPFLKIEGVERAVLGVDDDLRLALKQQYERAAGGADVDRLPQPVQHKHMLV